MSKIPFQMSFFTYICSVISEIVISSISLSKIPSNDVRFKKARYYLASIIVTSAATLCILFLHYFLGKSCNYDPIRYKKYLINVSEFVVIYWFLLSSISVVYFRIQLQTDQSLVYCDAFIKNSNIPMIITDTFLFIMLVVGLIFYLLFATTVAVVDTMQGTRIKGKIEQSFL